MTSKLYIVVRKDMSLGDQMCQAVHAAVDWSMRFPDHALEWWNESNTIVILAVPDEWTLLQWANALPDELNGCLVVEPDMNDEHTAFVVEPAAAKYLSSLPLAMKEVHAHGSR